MNLYNLYIKESKEPYLMKEKEIPYQEQINNPEKICKFMNEKLHMNDRAEEYVYLVGTDTKNVPIGIFELSHGTVNMSFCNTREIFIRLLISGSSNFFIVHNHPSGNEEPSTEDITTARKISEAAKIMGIKFLDSIIIGKRKFFSFAEQNLL